LRKKPQTSVGALSEKWHKILIQKVVFYKNLAEAEQERFGGDVMHFLASVKIIGVLTEIDIIDKLLIASSAVIPVFGFSVWNYTFLDVVIVRLSSLDSDFNIWHSGRFAVKCGKHQNYLMSLI
jgi:MtfA peptidase